MPGSLYIYQTFKQYQLRKCHKQSKIIGNFASLLPFLLPNLHNAQSANNKQHYRNTFTSTLKTWGNEIQQFYFNELCFLNLFYFFLFSYNIENKTRHIHIFPRNCKDDLYRDNVGKPEAQSTDVENSQRE